ncbi:DMT family transporter [Vagococcus sp. BWB3-3]|uniref:DMT family transporter n=1 Tax=Vagococcus allomyrinae TaxID=2794353 RepID=A0A940P6K1_9ENTE|nr:DMT family transporter [Vagococcus allomyrinae]MBP1040681.1 DMT family transporter [Vagococcus allomyrinae]
MKESTKNNTTLGHVAALITIFLWGTTFISTKFLLEYISPLEILVFRFILGWLVLLIMAPKLLKTANWKEELLFVGAGLSGVTLYFLLENIALTYTLASNVGVIVAISPFFTALLASIFLKEETLRLSYFIGFLISLVGICILSFGSGDISFSSLGDILAILASVCWGFYSILTKKISNLGYANILTTRRIFTYGILFMVVAMPFLGFNPVLTQYAHPVVWSNLLFLGIGASAFCFVSWNYAVKVVGAVKTSVYIYLVPVVTVTFSVLILHEPLTWQMVIGIILAIIGLLISERK